MDTPFHEFTLTDADGATHRYEVLPHQATDGQAILVQLVAIAAEPVGRLASGIFQGGGLDSILTTRTDEKGDAEAGAKVADLLDLDVAAVTSGIDFGALGADIRKAIQSIPMGKLGADILRHTMRDGKKLSDRVVFDGAYTRNYFEYLRALWEVVQINRFLPLSAISGLATSGR